VRTLKIVTMIVAAARLIMNTRRASLLGDVAVSASGFSQRSTLTFLDRSGLSENQQGGQNGWTCSNGSGSDVGRTNFSDDDCPTAIAHIVQFQTNAMAELAP
jgi:hypothetical protein